MRQILGDLKRAVISRPFLIAFIGMVLCLCIGAFSDALSVFRMEEVRVINAIDGSIIDPEKGY